MNSVVRHAAFLSVLVFSLQNRGITQSARTEDWLQDFAQLKEEMSSHYANLQWVVEHRKLDLKNLSERTEVRLRSATTDGEARGAIESFLDEFGDGHLWAEWPPGNGRKDQADTSEQHAARLPLRDRLGYHEEKVKSGIAFSMLPAYQALTTPDSVYFPAGVLHLPHNMNVGILRIGLFTEHIFPRLCDTAMAELGLSDESDCQGDCEDHVERKAANLLTKALERQLAALRSAKMNSLLVDITGNGGGSNWVEPAARELTSKRLQSPRTAFIRHSHWVEQLKDHLRIINADSGSAAGSHRNVLAKAADLFRQAIREADQPCDRTMMWQDVKPACSLVSFTPVLYPGCILPYAKPGELPDSPSSFLLFYPSRYLYREGTYSGPLMVLVDHTTASSAEYFAAILQDNHAATIVGEPTFGAGGGFTNGGIATVLRKSGGRIKMPDCMRLRGDGTNEMEGVAPDMSVP